MSEVVTVVITSAAGFDGTTVLSLTRDSFTKQGGRVYKADVAAAGVIPADMFGLFTGFSPKVVSVAVDTTSPLARVAVGHVSGGPRRESVNVTAAFQRVLMGPEDVLRVNTDARPARLTMLVNDLGEGDAFWYEKEEHRPVHRTRRFVVTKTDGTSWAQDPTPFSFAPAYFEGTRLFLASVTGAGCFRIADLIDTENDGAYVWMYGIGFGAAGTMSIYQIDTRTGEQFQLQNALPPVSWSNPRWFGYDDMFALSSTDPTMGVNVGVVIEVSPKRLRALP